MSAAAAAVVVGAWSRCRDRGSRPWCRTSWQLMRAVVCPTLGRRLVVGVAVGGEDAIAVKEDGESGGGAAAAAVAAAGDGGVDGGGGGDRCSGSCALAPLAGAAPGAGLSVDSSPGRDWKMTKKLRLLIFFFIWVLLFNKVNQENLSYEFD